MPGGVRRFIVSDPAFIEWMHSTMPDAHLIVSIMGRCTNSSIIDLRRNVGAKRFTLETCFTVSEIESLVEKSKSKVEVIVFHSP